MQVNILGVKIDDVAIPQIVDQVKEWLASQGETLSAQKHYIVTPNPEIVMMAQKDPKLKEIIKKADLAIPDGVGLKLSGDIECTSPGIDTMEALVSLAAEKGVATGFLGGEEGVAKKTAECLQKKYKNLKVVFAESGGEVDKEGKLLKSPKELKLLKCDLLFVAFGPPKQEKWIFDNLQKIPVKVAMGVGGSFDLISGKIPRAPVLIRKLGFEWLFRLIMQPWRIKRQLALIKYVLLLIIR